jgi:hypothetical protein
MATEAYQFKQQAFRDTRKKRWGANVLAVLLHTGCRDHSEVFSEFFRGGKAAGTLTQRTFTISITKLTM